MISRHFPLPDDLCNFRGTFGHEKVFAKFDTSFALVPQPRAERLDRLIDQDVQDDEKVSQQTYSDILQHVLELGLPFLVGQQ